MVKGDLLESLCPLLHLGVERMQHCKHARYVVLTKVQSVGEDNSTVQWQWIQGKMEWFCTKLLYPHIRAFNLISSVYSTTHTLLSI